MGNFIGIEWHWWKIVGWCGNLVFFSRFVVQWIATEKKKCVVIPVAFWWLSLTGATLLLLYSVFHLADSVLIAAYLPTFVPYVRNIVIHYRQRAAQKQCTSCHTRSAGHANYCHHCGERFVTTTAAAQLETLNR